MGSSSNNTEMAFHRPLTSTVWKPPCPEVPAPLSSRGSGRSWPAPSEFPGSWESTSTHGQRAAYRVRASIRQLAREGSATCESSDKDLVIVTGCLQRWPYKMVTSPTSPFDKPSQPDVLLGSLSNWCKVWRPESCIFHPASCVLSFDTGSGVTFASDYQSALIRRGPPCPKMSKLERKLGPFTQQILARLGGLSVTQRCSVPRSFRISS